MKKLILCFLMLPGLCWAWGRRGHQIVAETGSLLADGEGGQGFMRNHSFDLGYYANVPDFIWKRPATYETERSEHYMDLEPFDKAFAAKPEVREPYALSRKDFDARFPEVPPGKGRAFWRIRELNDQLSEVSDQMRALKEPTGKARQALQEKWIVLAGVMAHYVGDLGMPLHVTDNHDGQLTGQKGVHSYFEDALVDQVFVDVAYNVQKRAAREWPAFKKKSADKTVLGLLEELAKSSYKAIDPLLKLDKKTKRDPTAKTAKLFQKTMEDRLTASALVIAELYRRQLKDLVFDDNRFYFIAGEPAYIKPGVPEPAAKK